MSWMNLPTNTGVDKYVDPNNGSDSFNGNSWTTAYETCSRAASQSGSYGRVWLAPGNHVFSSTVTYEEKRLQWIGPPIPAGFEDPFTGSAVFTGSGLSRFMDARVDSAASPSNLFGGGWHNIAFNMDAISAGGEAIRARQLNYVKITGVHGRASSGTYKAARMFHSSESNYATPAANQDRSWWYWKDVSAFNCAVVYNGDNPSDPNVGSNAWDFFNVWGDCDDASGASLPYVHHDQAKAGGWWLEGCHFRNNASSTPCVLIDNRTVSNKNNAVNIAGVTFDDLQTPYHGVELYKCRATIAYPGGNGTTDGLFWADTDSSGYFAGPTSGISGETGNSISVGAF